MTIRTEHIAKALTTAMQLANNLHGMPDDERLMEDSHGRAELYPEGGATSWMALERAANLARHAADELEDELLRARFHWPVV